ncbi:MAG: amino acid ABC transporter permease [Oscillospiraceae bacterium]|nr:amino acid ABC transporter permease [Oscillospiraceae bacterium]
MFIFCFVDGSRYKVILEGLGLTLKITLFSALLGVFLGLILSIMSLTSERRGKKTIWSRFAYGYIDVIRGTPTVVQLMIVYFAILAPFQVDKELAAVIAFGINSSAYVSEIIRGGILSVDKGQMEAGRSLGMNYSQTMGKIIIPQAIKNILPAMGNEAIVLLKETSIVGYIGAVDLTKAGDFIISRTYKAFMPLIAIAVVYFIIVKLMTIGLRALEGRLRKRDSR